MWSKRAITIASNVVWACDMSYPAFISQPWERMHLRSIHRHRYMICKLHDAQNAFNFHRQVRAYLTTCTLPLGAALHPSVSPPPCKTPTLTLRSCNPSSPKILLNSLQALK